MASRAVLNEAGTHYVINGRKSWVTSAPYADFITLFTMTQPELSHRGVSAFLIETDQPGFERGKTEPKLGIRPSATSEIIFDNYACPIEIGWAKKVKASLQVSQVERFFFMTSALSISGLPLM